MKRHALYTYVLYATVLLSFAVSSAPAHAERMVYFVFAFDTADPSIGLDIKADLADIQTLLALNLERGNWSSIVMNPGSLTSDGIRRQIDQLPTDADDAIVFLYDGHGGYSNENTGEHIFKAREEIPRREVLDALGQKGAALTVLLSNACHNYYEPPKQRFGTRGEPAPALGRLTPGFRSLFYQSNGFFDITACQREEKAYCIPTSPQTGNVAQGSLFFKGVNAALSQHANDPSYVWSAFVRDVGNNVAQGFAQRVQGKTDTTVDTPSGQIRQRTQTVVANRLDDRGNVAQNNTPPINNTDLLPNFPIPDNTPPNGANQNPDSWRSDRLGVVVLGSNQGVRIADVQPDGPATRCFDRNGNKWFLNAGDYITRVNGQVIQSVDDFRTAVENSQQQMQFACVGADDSRTYNFVVQLAGQIIDDQPPAPPPAPQGNRLRFGVVVADTENGFGVVVTSVQDDSPATRCIGSENQSVNVEPGDVIVSINGREIRSTGDLTQAVRNSGRRIEFSVINVRDGNSYQIVATLND